MNWARAMSHTTGPAGAAEPTGRRWGRRHLLIALCVLAIIIGYTDRVNMSVASVAMRTQFGWTQTTKGFVLSAFFVGYISFLYVGAWLATRFGGKRVLGLAVLIWSICTLLTPIAASISMSFLIAVRIAMGIGEAAMFPATYELFGRWVPPVERTGAVAAVFSGISIGTVVGLAATAWITARYGWPMAFYGFGILGLLWVAIWFVSVSNDHAADPRLTPSERALIDEISPGGAPPGEVPWRQVFAEPAFRAVVITHFSTTWSLYVFLTWLPSYLSDVQGLTVAKSGFFSAAPWIAMCGMTYLAAAISGALLRRSVSLANTRKLMQAIGLLGSASLLVLTSHVHTPAMALGLLCGAAGALGFAWSGYAPNLIDLAPRHSALLGAFSNTIATIPGIVAVSITGWLVDATGTYTAAFVLSAAVSVIGALVFVRFGSTRAIVK
ncbi:MAG: transporter [Gammaproteobacteria bacterium]|nr:transporter [Gammaproteobacteria bacterium]